MAESKTVTVVPLNSSNYPTWKVQCRMALMKDGLWGIVNGTETPPDASQADNYAKFVIRRDRALAIIVLSVEPSLLYLLGDPEDPVTVWKKLSDQFQKKTWSNKLELRRKLYSLHLKEGESVQQHIKAMTEIFDGLSIIGDPVKEEDRVVHLLASLPESFNMLVTALEANTEVPKMDIVTERLLHEERKLKNRDDSGITSEKAMTSHSKGKFLKCYHCGKLGHTKRNCRLLSTEEQKLRSRNESANKAMTSAACSSGNESDALIVCHALSAYATTSNWIVDSGATCHMCGDSKLFKNLQNLEQPIKVSLGDGHTLHATGRGNVLLQMKLPNGKLRRCKLLNVLLVPKLYYNLLSVSKALESGKTIEFNEFDCQILDSKKKLIAVATKVGSLFCLSSSNHNELANVADQETKECVWHRRFGHLGLQNLQKLAREELVHGFDFNLSKQLDFCETCAQSKHHRSQFPTGGRSRAMEALALVHTDVCGKMNAKSLGGAEYFLTFIDDFTHYTWIYILKKKDEVFKCFVEWKALVEKSSGRKLKTLRSDNGGEYVSTEFNNYLQSEGIRHEYTVPKTPEQNGVAERMNRTIMETVRSMLVDANLPHSFWAEAVSTAVYLRNRSPTIALQNMTPYEAWMKKKPKIKHLRVFGCDAYAHVAKDERKKLESKSRKCIFLGYGELVKGYRLYDPDRGRVIYSRDVLFNEKKYEVGRELTGEEKKQYVELEYATDHEIICDNQDSDMSEAIVEPVARCSQRVRQPPDFYGVRVNVTNAQLEEPTTLEEAIAGPDKERWYEAMENEMKSLRENDVYELVELPKDRSPVGSKWVFKIKTAADGSVERYKARLVAQGFSQKFGTDYDETFCPVVRLESLRTLIAVAVQNGLKLHQIDVTTAFLNGKLEEEVFMRQPKGFIVEGQEHLVCRLKKSIYGLKQSPRCWNSVLDSQLKKMGFVQANSDPCIYKASAGETFYMGVYVDDIVLAAMSKK